MPRRALPATKKAEPDGLHCTISWTVHECDRSGDQRLGEEEVNDIRAAATVFVASNLRKVGRFPDSSADELWTADIKACGSARQCRVFTGVMFVESIGAVFIFGIEHEDGRPRGVKAELAERQQLFIDFLREQNEISDLAMGGLRAIFQGSEYAAEARATAAYTIHREHLTDLALRAGHVLRPVTASDSDHLPGWLANVQDWVEGQS